MCVVYACIHIRMDVFFEGKVNYSVGWAITNLSWVRNHIFVLGATKTFFSLAYMIYEIAEESREGSLG